jgi:hypothetical protein
MTTRVPHRRRRRADRERASQDGHRGGAPGRRRTCGLGSRRRDDDSRCDGVRVHGLQQWRRRRCCRVEREHRLGDDGAVERKRRLRRRERLGRGCDGDGDRRRLGGRLGRGGDGDGTRRRLDGRLLRRRRGRRRLGCRRRSRCRLRRCRLHRRRFGRGRRRDSRSRHDCGRGRDHRSRNRGGRRRDHGSRNSGGERRRGRRLGRCGRRHGRHERGQERERIEVAVVVGRGAHAEVDVRHRQLRRAARADRADQVALRHRRALRDRRRSEMCEGHGERVWSQDRDGRAARRHAAGERDDAGGGRDDGGAGRGADVDATVLPAHVGVRGVECKRREDGPRHGPGPRRRGGHGEQEEQDDCSESTHRTLLFCCQNRKQ